MRPPRAGAAGLAIVSMLLLGGAFLLDSPLGWTTRDAFCLSCHEMATNIGGHFEQNLWLPGTEERHAGCADCHLPQRFVPRTLRKLRAARELYHHVIGTIATKEKFESRRMAMARTVWEDLQSNRSGECTGCHDAAAAPSPSVTASAYHERAAEHSISCIGCHKGIVHAIDPTTPATEGYDDAAPCLQCHDPRRVNAIWDVPHSDPAASGGTAPGTLCEDCHAMDANHLRYPIDRGGRTANTHAASGNSCAECHREGKRADWQVHAHGSDEASCDSCHRIHPGRDGRRTPAGSGATCTASCHAWIQDEAAGEPTSTETDCMSCHNPHLPPETTRCESCHRMDAEARADQTPEARRFHTRGQREGLDCGECHKGIIHQSPHIELVTTLPPSP